MQFRPKFVLKLVVSIVLFAIVLSRVDIGAVSQTIAKADALPLWLAVLLSLAMNVTDAAQWQSVLASLGHRITFKAALAYSFSGSFFGVFGPSSLGVDVYRAAQMRRLGISTEIAVRAVVTTRLMAFVSLLAVIATGLPIAFALNLTLRDQILLCCTFLAGLTALFAILLLDPIRRNFSILRRVTIAEKLADISKDLRRAVTSKRHAATSLFLATATHVLRLSTFAALAWAFHTWVGFWPLYALIPISLLVAMIPITIGSWGVREISVIYFLGWAGVGIAAALSMSVAFGILRLVMAFFGGAVWVVAGSHHYTLQIADKSE